MPERACLRRLTWASSEVLKITALGGERNGYDIFLTRTGILSGFRFTQVALWSKLWRVATSAIPARSLQAFADMTMLLGGRIASQDHMGNMAVFDYLLPTYC